MSLAILWSVPRSRSTAFERMMYERGDFQCFHEPFSRVSDFGNATLGATQCANQAEVAASLIKSGREMDVFVKDTTDFSMRDAFDSVPDLYGASHALMWRAPIPTINSHLKLSPHATAADIGYGHMLQLAKLLVNAGVEPTIIEGDAFAREPRREYERYCSFMGIDAHDNPETFTKEPPPEWSLTARWHEDAATRTAVTQNDPPTPSTALSARAKELLNEVSGDYSSLCAMFSDQLPERTPNVER